MGYRDALKYALKGDGRATRRHHHHKKAYTEFKHYSAIIVPSTLNKRPMSRASFMKRVKETADEYTATFGGTTRFAGFGTVTDEKSGKVIGENVTKVESYSDAKHFNKLDVLRFARKKKKDWGQDSVGIEIEDAGGDRNMYFV